MADSSTARWIGEVWA